MDDRKEFYVKFRERYCYCSTKPLTNIDWPCWVCATIYDFEIGYATSSEQPIRTTDYKYE